jgi:hypothetical protein
MVLTVSFVLSPVTGLSCHRHRRSYLHRLDTSVGVSGPHDFAVRCSIIRPRARRAPDAQRPPHPAPYVRDDREAPLLWERDKESSRDDLGRLRSGIFLRRGLDRLMGDLPVGRVVSTRAVAVRRYAAVFAFRAASAPSKSSSAAGIGLPNK